MAACAFAVAASGCSWVRAYRSRVTSEEAFAAGATAAAGNDLAGAERDFARALRLAPRSASLSARIGMAYMEMTPPRDAAALPHLERALKLDSRQPPMVYLDGVLALARQGREEAARRLLVLAARRFRDDGMALNNIGYVLADADKLTADALPLLERAVKLEPRNGIVVDSLGWAHYRLRHLPEAARLLRLAVKRAPNEAEIAYHLGVVYAALGRTAAARAQFRRAVKHNPAFIPARAALRALERKLK